MILRLLIVLLALAAAPARAQFTDQRTWGGSASGTNTISITVPNWTANLAGVPLRFIPTNTNTGAVTLNVSGLGAVTANKRSSSGLSALAAGDIVSGQLTEATFDGSVFVIGAAPRVTQTPTVQTLCAAAKCTTNAASGSYVPTAGVAWIKVTMVGSGGGGGGSGAGGNGNPTTFNAGTLTSAGGTGGGGSGTRTGGAGGTGGSGGSTATIWRFPGGSGGAGAGSTTGATNVTFNYAGGTGGMSCLGGTTGPDVAGLVGTGSGGGGLTGAGTLSAAVASSGGGGGGECATFYAAAATYTWVAGAAGTAGAGGGFAGGSGILVVEEHYNYLLDPANDNRPMFLAEVA